MSNDPHLILCVPGGSTTLVLMLANGERSEVAKIKIATASNGDVKLLDYRERFEVDIPAHAQETPEAWCRRLMSEPDTKATAERLTYPQTFAALMLRLIQSGDRDKAMAMFKLLA